MTLVIPFTGTSSFSFTPFVAASGGLGGWVRVGEILRGATQGAIPAETQAEVSQLLEGLESSGLLSSHLDLLRRLAEGETVVPEQLAVLAARIGVVEAADRPEAPVAEVQEALRHLTGPATAPVATPLWRHRTAARTSGAIQLKPEGMEHMVFCPTCHFANPDRAKFCNECSMPLVEMPEIRPEERDMTMLFTDLKGFDDFSRGLRPEVLFPLMNEILAGLGSVATSEGGHLVGSWGDAVFVAFGTPDKPMEDHPVRAVRTALKMQEFMRTWSERQIAQGRRGLELRVGINTGTVAWGVLGLPGKRDQNGMGEEINIAARLEPIASRTDERGDKHGAIAVSESTLERLQGRFETVEMGEQTVKTRTVRYHLVVREIPRATALAPKGAEQIRFRGRDREMAALTTNFQTTVGEKKGRLVVVSAEAGLGKSRLGAEFIGAIGRLGVELSLVTAHGEDLPAVAPYHAIARALEGMAGFQEGESEEERRQKLISLVQRTVSLQESDLELTTQLLGNLLGVEFETVHPVMQTIQRSAEDLRERTLDAVVTFFDHLSQRRAVVLMVEDLHWIDRGTQRYLQVLLERLQERPFLVVGLTRPEFFDVGAHGDAPPLMQGPYPVERIDLGALSREDLGLMVDEILGEAATADVREFLISESRGNPYILQEMARSVRAGWRVAYEVTHDAKGTETRQGYLVALDGRRVPGGAQGFLQARVDHLPPAQQRILRTASVVGAEFSTEELEALALDARDAGDVAQREASLVELSRQSLLIPVSEGRYQFPHALLRETVYSQIPAEERRALHRGVAWHLIHKGSEELALIASHMERGGENDPAAQYYSRAAEAAAHQGAFRSAATFYEKVDQLSGDLREPNQKIRRIRALFGWEEVLFDDKMYAEATPLLGRFDDILPLIPTGEREMVAEARFHKARILAVNARAPEGIAEIEGGLQLYRPDEATEVKCSLLNFLVRIYWLYHPDYQKGGEIARAGLDAARRLGRPDYIMAALLEAALIETTLGRSSGALAANLEAVKICRQVGDLRTLARALNNTATILILLGKAEEAVPLLREGIEISRRQLSGHRLDMLLLTYGQAAIYLRRYDEAISYLEDGLPLHKGHSPSDNLAEMHLHLALAYEGKKDWPRCLEAGTDALRVAGEIPDETEEARAQTMIARAHLDLRNLDAAITASSEAIRILEKVGGISEFEDEIFLTHVRVLAASGRYDEAMAWADRAKRMVDERAAKITNEEHRRSFIANVPPVREIQRLWQLLRVMTAQELSPQARVLLDRLNFYPPPVLPEEVRFVELGRIGEISRREGDRDAAAGTLVDLPLAQVLASLVSRPVTVERNPKDGEEGMIAGVWAKNIRWEPFFGEDGTLYSFITWDMDSIGSLHRVIFPLIGEPAHRQELLKDQVYTRNGAVFVELRRADITSVRSAAGTAIQVDPDIRPRRSQFGTLRFILVPTPDNKTILVLEMETRPYTQMPWNFLEGFVRAMTT